jgi:hypothetical protein
MSAVMLLVWCLGLLLVWAVAYGAGFRAGAQEQERKSAEIATRRARLFNGRYEEGNEQ